MRKVEALKALSIAIGVEAASLADASTVVDVLNVIAAHFEGDDDAEFIGDAIANIAAIAGSIVPEPTLIEKTITANDTYNASDDNADGYSKVTVNVESENNAKFVSTPSTFNMRTNLAHITLPIGITAIDNYGLQGITTPQTLEIPDGVETIGSSALSNSTGFTAITIPSSMRSIESNSFYGCTNVTSITVNKPENSISGAPWGATNAQIIWTG